MSMIKKGFHLIGKGVSLIFKADEIEIVSETNISDGQGGEKKKEEITHDPTSPGGHTYIGR